MIKMIETLEGLNPTDELLWQAMETLRGLAGSEFPLDMAEKIEKHFGVYQALVDDRVWCKNCDNHVRKDDPCYIVCGGQR